MQLNLRQRGIRPQQWAKSGFEINCERLQDQIDDLEKCLKGDSSSKKWQEINLLRENKRGDLRAAISKHENNSPVLVNDIHERIPGFKYIYEE